MIAGESLSAIGTVNIPALVPSPNAAGNVPTGSTGTQSTTPPSSNGCPVPQSYPQSPVTPPPYTPQPSRIPETNSLDDALAYWEHGSPAKGLDVPLKNWSTLFKSSEYASEAVKLGNIRFVCEEFQGRCGGDYTTFEERYPGMRGKFTILMKAVRVQRKLRGETRSRNSRTTKDHE
ncbi:hypothetical protein B0H13DRAFT_1925036 [Mycena leptocephala]|nr:hypothetical protein B0H13DRAFT_1925036 [Mycena leptocephala]